MATRRRKKTETDAPSPPPDAAPAEAQARGEAARKGRRPGKKAADAGHDEREHSHGAEEPEEPEAPEAAMDRMLAERKIQRAFLAIGVTFADCAGYFRYDPRTPTASWSIDSAGREEIRIGPMIAGLDVDCVEMALRHELLHRSIYNDLGERFSDRELSNIVLDICINRLLFEAFPQKMAALSEAIFAPETHSTIIALVNGCASPVSTDENPELEELWDSIWLRLPDGTFPDLNPTSLYYRLLRLKQVCRITIPSSGGTCVTGGHDRPRSFPSERTRSIAQHAARSLNQALPRGSSLGRGIDQFSVLPVQIGTNQVEDFMRRIAVRRIASETAAKVLTPHLRVTRVQPYPGYPSRMGIVYQLCGLTDLFGLHWNRVIDRSGARMAISIYLDVSGSMEPKFSIISGFVAALKEFPLRTLVFDDGVREVDVEEMAAGKIVGGGGTDFDPPVRDFIGEPSTDAAVLFTDGEAPISDEVGRLLAKSKKRLYVVYLLDPGSTATSSPIDRYARGTLSITYPPP